jgi:hypothetical protein
MNKDVAELAVKIANAVRIAFSTLFKNKGHYYYCVILTTGEALLPYISAWSHEAMDRLVESRTLSASRAYRLKYSPTDSPYEIYGEEYFNE